MGQCNATIDEIAKRLGDFTCQDAPAIIHLRSSFGLSNWTLPVLELMMAVYGVATAAKAPESTAADRLALQD